MYILLSFQYYLRGLESVVFCHAADNFIQGQVFRDVHRTYDMLFTLPILRRQYLVWSRC